MKRLAALVAIMLVSLAVVLGASSSPSDSPGGIRVIENDEWVLFRNYYTASGSVTVSGSYTTTKLPGGVLRIDLLWTDTSHTWIDVNLNVTEATLGQPR